MYDGLAATRVPFGCTTSRLRPGAGKLEGPPQVFLRWFARAVRAALCRAECGRSDRANLRMPPRVAAIALQSAAVNYCNAKLFCP